MKIVLIQTGKTNIKYISEGVDEYVSRIRKYSAFDIITVPEIKNQASVPRNDQKRKEAESIMKLIGSDDYVIALDEKGKEYRSVELAEQIQRIFLLSKKRLVFIIGGPWGFASEIHDRAEMRLSLSKLTFSHQLVRLLFAEQLYRVLTVIKGDPYHHE
jgi:23S rRNA (pseudouridine1915-N3)-methyltransferase